MDAIQGPGLIGGSEPSLEIVAARVRSPGRSARRPPFLGRSWLTIGLASLSLLIAAWFNFIELPIPITVADGPGGRVVASVSVGSHIWINGVRQGMAYRLNDDARRFEIALGAGGSFGGDVHRKGNFTTELAIAAAVLMAAVLLGAAKLPGSAAAAGVGVGLALMPALAVLGLPGSIPLMLLSGATAASAVRIPDRRRQRLFDAVSVTALVGLVVLALALLAGYDPGGWDLVWKVPLFVAVTLAVMGEAVGVRYRLSVSPESGQSRVTRLLHAIVPLAATSRLDGAEEERSRLAIELHNRVIPQVSSSAQAIRETSSVAEATADRLDALAEELRGVVDRQETVTLESGGVGAGLRAHLEGMSTYGLQVAFDIRDDRGRPPSKVELAGYRIGQAAIDNALRHSGGDRVDVSVSSGAGHLELVIKDDGVGIGKGAEESARRRGRIGLAQMWLRAEAVGGSLEIRGHAGSGTEVRFKWSA